jgi:preprotein translocase subunit SecD
MGRRSRLSTWWAVTVLSAALVLGACDDDGGSSAPEGVSSERVVFAVDEGGDGANASDDELEAAAEILERRFTALGVEGADATVDGEQIVVTGGGVQEWAEDVTATGEFEIRPVEAIVPPQLSESSDPPGRPEGVAIEGPDGLVELDVLPLRDAAATGSAEIRYGVGESVLGGDAVRAAKAEFFGGSMGWIVVMRLSDDGERTLDDLARERVRLDPPRNAIAIVVDGAVVSAPVFNEPNFRGDLQITPFATEREAQVLAALLGDGPLPVPLKVAA